MTLNLTMQLVFFALVIIIINIYYLRKSKINIKYSLIWFLSAFIMLFLAILPNLFKGIVEWLGFELASNMLFSVLIGILIIVSISLTIIVSNQDAKIRLLIQELSTLKSKK